MRLALAMMSTLLSLSYTQKASFTYDSNSTQCQVEMKEGSKKSLQNLANSLYAKMNKKEDILALFFESYGEKYTGFYVEKNHPSEEKYFIFHADDHRNGKTAVIKTTGDFKNIESVTLKKIKDGKAAKEVSVSPEDKDTLLLYRRMLEAAVEHIDEAEVTKHPLLGNLAKYNYFIKDNDFVSSLENLISKTGI